MLMLAGSSFSQIKSIDVNSLAALMEGAYSTSEQSIADNNYKNLTLKIKRIWTSGSPERSDPQWLYVEISDSTSSVPFRQMMCKLSFTNEGRFEQNFFNFKNGAINFSGELEKENPFSGLNEDSLQKISGCSLIVTLMNDNSYEGGLYGENCESEVPGSGYPASDIIISSGGIRIINKTADKEGYFFKRIK